MVTYKLFTKQVSQCVRIEVIYENFPVIAGTEEMSVLVQFRYTGEMPKAKEEPERPDGSQAPNDNSGMANEDSHRSGSASGTADDSSTSSGWGRISTQLTNATRALFLQQLATVSERDEDKEEEEEDITKNDISLYLGYGQVLGYYTVNDKIVDFSIFQDLQKSTVIGGKFAGIDTLDASDDVQRDGRGVLAQISSLYSTDLDTIDKNFTAQNIRMVPFYSTTQSILFSEISFEPSKWDVTTTKISPINDQTIRSFYLNFRLPKDLPPTFLSDACQISYKLVLGYQLLVDNQFIHKTIMIPLKIQPYVDKFGRQPLFHLERARINERPTKLLTVDMNGIGSERSHSRSSSRRVNFKSIRRNVEGEDGGGNNKVKSRKSSAFSFESIRRRALNEKKSRNKNNETGGLADSFTGTFMELASELDKASVNEVAKVQGQFEAEMNKSKQLEFNSRENLIHIMADYKSVQREKYDARLDEEEGIEYLSMIPQSEQTKYLIMQNRLEIATLELDKAVFKVGDLINLSLSFEGADIETKGLEIQLLRSQVFYREEYLKKGNYDQVYEGITNEKNLETVLFEKLVGTFDCESVSMDLLVPLETEPQFRTNFFDVKYYIQVRFILLDEYGALRKKRDEKKVEEGGGEGTENEELLDEKPVRKVFDLQEIFIDRTGSMLFKGKEDFESGYEFTVRIPVVVLANYEQDFGSVGEV
ncbi:DEKNAAC101481 [Brettanomyces naardenensis]|uniref:DEKNAAC101481 n=1 Tax=Brettanomyces naardenensis TaxID=13370 RepID=A0A448YI15_BRENA|nr:DEKNAAC101481 [Brettanomyces naardenensis]